MSSLGSMVVRLALEMAGYKSGLNEAARETEIAAGRMQKASGDVRGASSLVSDAMNGNAAAALQVARAVGVGGVALGAAAAAAGAAAYAYYQGSKEADAYRKVLIETGAASGVTAGQMQYMAARMAEVGITQGKAAEALVAMANAGVVGASSMEAFASSAARYSKATGASVDDVAKKFADLAGSPVRASAKLNESMHYLTGAVYEQIKALEDQGRHTDAVNLAQKTLADTLDSRTSAMVANLGYIEKAWKGVKDAALGAGDWALNIGRQDLAEKQVTALAKQRDQLQAALLDPSAANYSPAERERGQQRLDAINKELAALSKSVLRKQENAAADAVAASESEASVKWIDRVTASLSNQEKKRRELIAAANEAAAAGSSVKPGELEYQQALINQKYDTGADVAAVKIAEDQKLQIIARAQSKIDMLRATGQTTQIGLVAETNKLEIAAIDARIDANRKEAEIVAKRPNSERELVQLNQQLRALEEERSTAAVKGSNAVIAARYAEWKVIKDQSQALNDQAKMIELESQIWAKSDSERARLTTNLQIELNLEKELKRIKESGQSADDIKAQSDVARANALMEQQQAFEKARNAYFVGANKEAKDVADSLNAVNAELALGAKLVGESAQVQQLENEKLKITLELEKKIRDLKDRGDLDEADKIAKESRLRREAADQEIAAINRITQDYWKATVEGIQTSLTDAIIAGIDGSKPAILGLRDAFVKEFENLVLRPQINAIIKPIATDIASWFGITPGSMGAAGQASGANTLLGAANSASSLNTLYGAGSQFLFGGTAGASTASLAYANGVGMVGGDSMGALISANGGWAGVSTAASAGATEGALVGTKAALYSELGYTGAAAGTAATGSAVGGTAAGASSGSLMGMSYTGWGIIVAAILSQLGGPQIDRVGGGLQGSIGGGGGSNLSAYNVYKEDHHGLFGIGAFTTENREYGAANAEVTKFINEQIKTITDSAKKYGEALGVPVEKIDGFTKQIDVNLTNLDAAGVQKALQDAINGFADDLTNSAFGDAMAQFAKAGESTGTTLMRVTAEVGTVNATLAKLGGQLFNLDAAGIKAADGLVQAMGGLEAFQQQTASYYQNYYTQEEQRQMQAQDIAAKLAASGVNVSVQQVLDGTREQFRALVESFTANGGLLTESGQKAVAALMSVADAFASITDASKKSQEELQKEAEQKQSITHASPMPSGGSSTPAEIQIYGQDFWKFDKAFALLQNYTIHGYEALGQSIYKNLHDSPLKTYFEGQGLQSELEDLKEQLRVSKLTPEELAAEKAAQAKKALEWVSPENKELYQQVLALRKQLGQNGTSGTSGTNVSEERNRLQDQYNQLTMTELQLRALERDSIALSNRDLYDRITAIKSAQKELDAAKTGVSNAMSSLQRAVDAEKQSIEAARQAAQERASILGGIVSTLGDAVDGIRGNVESTKAAAAARGNAFITDALATAKVSGYMPDADALKKAIGDARAGLDVNNYTSQFEYEKAQLELAGKLDGLKEIADPQLTAAKQAVKVAEDQLKALDAQLKLAQDQIDALNGIDTSVKSVAEAMTALTAAIGAQKAAQDHLTGLTGGGGGGTTATTSWTGEKTGTLTNSFWQMWGDTMYRTYGEQAGFKVYDMAKSQGITLADLDKAMGWTDGHAKAWALAHGLPAFAVGTNYVPRDMVAQIHEGEAIVPKAYNPAAGGASGNARLESLVEALTAEVQRLQAIVNDGNTHAQRTANAVNGNPEVPMLVTTV